MEILNNTGPQRNQQDKLINPLFNQPIKTFKSENTTILNLKFISNMEGILSLMLKLQIYVNVTNEQTL